MPLPVFSLMLVVFSLTTSEFVIAGILPDGVAELVDQRCGRLVQSARGAGVHSVPSGSRL